MYLPPHFEEARAEELHSLIEAHPLGIWVVNGPAGLDANHVPFHLELNPTRLLAHVARANPVWKDVKDGDETLVIFRAEQAYVSPNWYPSKHELHRQVPTWNYRVVHAHGRVAIRDDQKFVRGLVARLTRTHEARTGDQRSWKMGDSSLEYIDEMLAKIVGVEVEVTRLVGKWKLSQNREARDRINAAEELRKRGEETLAREMLKAD